MQQSRTLQLLPWIILILVCALLTGCGETKGDPYVDENGMPIEPDRLPISNKLQFDDVPVPIEFEYMRDYSFVYKHENVRVGKLVYEGRAGLQDVILFYEENMSASGWSNGTTHQYGRRASLRYEKQMEVCLIDLEANGSKVHITAQITPAK